MERIIKRVMHQNRGYIREPTREPTFLCSFPKSGRTWLRFILGNYFNQTFDLGLTVDLHTLFYILPNYEDNPERGPKAYRYLGQKQIPFILSSHSEYRDEFVNRDVIFMVRMIYDVLPSLYFQRSKHLKKYNGDLKEFIRDPERGVGRLMRYLNSWSGHLADTRSTILTYEELHENTSGAVSRVLSFLGLTTDEKLLRDAIERSSFTKMQEIELKKGIAGHEYDRGDPNSRRMREGMVGGYHKHLDASDQEYIRRECNATATPETGRLMSKFQLL